MGGRKALIVGINHYDHKTSLFGCINDANKIEKVLSYNEGINGKEKNFHTETIISGEKNIITTDFLRKKIEELFRDERETSLFYFAGHGAIRKGQGYLVTTENEKGYHGLSMNDILQEVNNSPARNKIIIFDCCHSGSFAKDFISSDLVRIKEGVTILAASAANQYSTEIDGEGIFTKLFCHALEGGAASIIGEITPGNVYGYIDKAMGEKAQRPIFITNVRRYISLRKIKSQIIPDELRQITILFKHPDYKFKLNRTFEHTEKTAITKNVEKFTILKLYNRVNLVIPIKKELPEGKKDMYWAAIYEKGCELTPQGKSYWEMVNRGIL
ncbi:MAG: caspase family protein [Flavobacteriaceae bacterium]|nr:caspase family protein [Flavobacteriaceae bacterium]